MLDNPNPEDWKMKEWAECRTTIGRFDTILVDLRKYGFSFVTTLLTAGTLFGISSVDNLKYGAVAVAFLITLALNAILFTIDVYYTSLHSGAVERALDLEAHLKTYRLTKYLCDNARHVWTVTVTLFLYLALQLVIIGMASWIINFGEIVKLPGIAIHFLSISRSLNLREVFIVASWGSVVWMLGYWLYASFRVHSLFVKPGRKWEALTQDTQIGRYYDQNGKERIVPLRALANTEREEDEQPRPIDLPYAESGIRRLRRTFSQALYKQKLFKKTLWAQRYGQPCQEARAQAQSSAQRAEDGTEQGDGASPDQASVEQMPSVWR